MANTPGDGEAAARERALLRAPLEVLGEVVRPLARYYESPEAEEIAVCTPYRVFVRLRSPGSDGQVWTGYDDDSLTYEYLRTFLAVASAVFGSTYDPTKGSPALYETLPGGHRLSAVAGRSVVYDEVRPEGGTAISIRQAPRAGERRLELADWGVRPGARLGAQEVLRPAVRRTASVYAAIFEAVRAKRPMLLSGPTSSGKTTLLNRLLDEVNPNLRIMTVEDARELRVRNPNRVHLLIDRNALPHQETPGRLSGRSAIDALVRMTPDAILVGEISTSNASMALQLLGAGHDNFWTSIHAGDPEEARHAFASRVRESEPDRPVEEIVEVLRRRMFIVQTARDGARRYISHVEPPEGL